MAGAAEGPGGAGVTVLRLRAATSQTSHLAVRPVNHLNELSHPEDGGGRVGKEETQSKDGTEGQRVSKRQDVENVHRRPNHVLQVLKPSGK